MHFTSIVTLSALAVSALGAPTASKLQPWQLQSLSTFSPSGYPGSSAYSSFDATIVDPNTITLGQGEFGPVQYPASQATCSTKWSSNPPWDQEIPCATNSSYSIWSFKLSKGTSGTTNFTLNFKLTDGAISPSGSGKPVFRTFNGGDHFEVGKNLAGECGGSGVCYWGLKSSPYAIKQQG